MLAALARVNPLHAEGGHSSTLFSTPEMASLVLGFVLPTLNLEQMVTTKVQSWSTWHARTRLRESEVSLEGRGNRLSLEAQSERMRS